MYAEANRQGRSTRVYTPARVLVVFLWQNALSPHGGARAASAYNTLNRVSSNIKCNQTRNGHRQDGTCNSIAAHSKRMGIFHWWLGGGSAAGMCRVCLLERQRARQRTTNSEKAIHTISDNYKYRITYTKQPDKHHKLDIRGSKAHRGAKFDFIVSPPRSLSLSLFSYYVWVCVSECVRLCISCHMRFWTSTKNVKTKIASINDEAFGVCLFTVHLIWRARVFWRTAHQSWNRWQIERTTDTLSFYLALSLSLSFAFLADSARTFNSEQAVSFCFACSP